jgi:hypothetical protein
MEPGLGQCWHLDWGEGRTKVYLAASRIGEAFLVCLYNQNIHLGAVAVAEPDPESGRVSTSVITRRGHKDDAVAQRAAYLVSKGTGKPVCAIAGIHIDNISAPEITRVLDNTEKMVHSFLEQLKSAPVKPDPCGGLSP